MNKKRRSYLRRLVVWIGVGLPLCCLLLVAVSALSNLGMPTHSSVVDRLSAEDKARLAEIYHLRQSLGDQVWPGWDTASIPVILYNESYAFLVNLESSEPGWRIAPDRPVQGGAWGLVPDDRFMGQEYYRLQLPNQETNPQAFTVLVGDHWVASFSTRQWAQISMPAMLRDDLPPLLQPVFPGRLVNVLMMNSSDWYISAVLHESFHAYQAQQGQEYLLAAERKLVEVGKEYPWDDPAIEAAWQAELDLLASGFEVQTPQAAAQIAEEFLALRAARRQQPALSPALIEYEQRREWLEGLAKYAEMDIWRAGAQTAGYQPVKQMASVADFDNYQGFEGRLSNEVDQVRRMAKQGDDTTFYYSGFSQAHLLDVLDPGWKEGVLESGEFLEARLAVALQTYNGQSSQ